MASLNQQIMARTREQLSGHWSEAVVASLIYILILSAASFTYVGELILTGPLTVGYFMYLTFLMYQGISDLNKLFAGFNNFVNTMVAGLVSSLLIAVGCALLIVPGVILACGFSMTFFILIDRPETSGMDAISESWKMMNGHKMEYFCLCCRFIGWVLLCLLTCGIGFLWLYPYMYGATANFYRNLRYGTF